MIFPRSQSSSWLPTPCLAKDPSVPAAHAAFNLDRLERGGLGPIWIRDLFCLATSSFPINLRHPYWVCPQSLSPSIGWPLSVCVGGLGGRAGLCQGSWDGGGALSFLLFIALGLWGGFPWPPPPPREGEGAWVSHRPGAGAQV